MRDTLSQQRLGLVHPELARRVRAAAAQLEAVGTFFRVAVGLRSYAESDRLYAQGRTAPGHIVTNARAGFSQHNHGLAVDCYPFLSGAAGDLNYNPDSPQFKAMVRALQAQGLAWGGDWRSITDPPHFQIAGITVTPTGRDRACFALGGCPAVWAQYTTVTDLQAFGHEHLSWPMLLWGALGGAARGIGQWLMTHFGHPLLTRLRQAWDNSSPAAPATEPKGETMATDLTTHTEPGTVTDLEASGFTDFFKNGFKGFMKLFTPDQEKKIADGVTTFIKTDVGALALDAVQYVKVALPGAGNVELRDAAVAKLKTDAAAAGKDLSGFAGAFFNWAIETALQFAISKGLQTVATIALAAEADETTKPAA